MGSFYIAYIISAIHFGNIIDAQEFSTLSDVMMYHQA